MGVALFHADRRTGRHDEASSISSPLHCERNLKVKNTGNTISWQATITLFKELRNGDPSAYEYRLNIITGKIDEILETIKLKTKKGLMVMRMATPTRTKIEAA